MNKLPRSLRNNNPFNIKNSSSRWLGKVKGNDKVFETFDSLEHGLRAGIKLIINYVKKGYNTPYKIINRFAPSSENNVSSYLLFVCSHCELSTDYVFSCNDVLSFSRFLYAITLYESGMDESEFFLYVSPISISYTMSNFNLRLPYEKD